MITRMRFTLHVTVVFSLLTTLSRADQAFEPDTVPEECFSPLINRSPFLRIVSVKETYDLHAVSRIGGRHLATIRHRKTGKRFIVEEGEDNDIGMKLLGVDGNSNPRDVVVKISCYGEEVEFAYRESLLEKKSTLPSQTVRRDREGRPVTTEELVKKYYSMTREQQKAYDRWKQAQLKVKPELRYSEKRFPIAHKALDAIMAGKALPPVR